MLRLQFEVKLLCMSIRCPSIEEIEKNRQTLDHTTILPYVWTYQNLDKSHAEHVTD